MNISEVAAKYNMTPATIRYYESQGLMPAITRNKSGTRDFQEEDLKWVEFIKCMRDSGLSIHSLSKYSELYQIGEETLIERKEILMDEYQKLLKKQAMINGTVAKLEKKIENYNYKIKQSSETLYTE
ncbi:MAG: MerR family transcriptional regulator [Carnobacterium sp.]|uniref:MerR family transcriptional regulator n=1 Tax=Carnobacterium TaxID=2747 RepID=UPI00191BAC2A|nr:MerR family transcriptional regulator [Carnobacterium maltaromaticum]CAD5897701.1 transcriptional regulator regulated by thiol-alkylation [Carnobacterium maltaromaticum]